MVSKISWIRKLKEDAVAVHFCLIFVYFFQLKNADRIPFSEQLGTDRSRSENCQNSCQVPSCRRNKLILRGTGEKERGCHRGKGR